MQAGVYREEPDLADAWWVAFHRGFDDHRSHVCSAQRTSNFVHCILERQSEWRFNGMTIRGFLSRHGIVRNAIKKDILFFGIPAFTVFLLGLIVSGRDGYDGLVEAIWELVKDPQNLRLLSIWNIAGLTLCVVGLTIALVAVFTLRRFYLSTLVIREDHQLITHGIYRFTRHPVYFGVLIAIMGVPVYAPSLYGFLVLSLLIPIFLNRIRMEEEMLTEEFGDAHRMYMETTRKLIPFIY